MNSQEQWRNFLLKVITSLKFLGECGLPVRGHNSNTGLFHELLKLRSTDSTSISKFISSPRLEYMSPVIQKSFSFWLMMFNNESQKKYEISSIL